MALHLEWLTEICQHGWSPPHCGLNTQSAYCYHLEAPTDAHKQLKTKTMITLTGNSESIQKFSCDEKNLTVEEFAEHTMNHLEFHGMDSEFYLPDLKT